MPNWEIYKMLMTKLLIRLQIIGNLYRFAFPKKSCSKLKGNLIVEQICQKSVGFGLKAHFE